MWVWSEEVIGQARVHRVSAMSITLRGTFGFEAPCGVHGESAALYPMRPGESSDACSLCAPEINTPRPTGQHMETSLMGYGPYRVAHAELHRLWTKAVGAPGYAKAEWMALERSIESLARKAAQEDARP